MMKVIFLDIDGVMNFKNYEALRKNAELGVVKPIKEQNWWEEINEDAPHPFHVNWLNKITDATNAKIVISSSWRDEFSDIGWLRFFALCKIKGEVIGRTPHLGTRRGVECLTWILRYNDEHYQKGEDKVDSWVCLDDDADFEIIADTLVLCRENGLTEKEADEAIEKLQTKIEIDISLRRKQ
jgi:hypothetical protein